MNRAGSNFTAVPLRVLTAPVYFLYPAIGFGLRLLDKTQTYCLKSTPLLGESKHIRYEAKEFREETEGDLLKNLTLIFCGGG